MKLLNLLLLLFLTVAFVNAADTNVRRRAQVSRKDLPVAFLYSTDPKGNVAANDSRPLRFGF